MTTQPTRLEVRANMQLTDEQIHAISHAQKVLRAVKLYDRAELLSASKPAAPTIGKNALVLSAAQLIEALEFIAPDRATDADQLETEIAIEYGEGHGGKATYCWCAEYPEEGSFILDGKSAASPAAPAHCQCAACKTGTIHASDCAAHNAPALPVGECDCGAAAPAQSAEPISDDHARTLWSLARMVSSTDWIKEFRKSLYATQQTSPTAVVLDERAALPTVCDGKEQDEFEAWAIKEKFDMSCHPLHWLFLNERTDAARQGWKGALEYVARSVAQPVEQTADVSQAKQIEQYVLSVLPSVYYTDPPDGGDVSVLEQLRRMADDAAKYRANLPVSTVDDLAMLVKKLVRHVRKASPDNNMAEMAMDYLHRHGLEGSPLRTVEQPVEQTRALTEDARDAARYRLLRRGQHWSVINGIGDTLRGEDLDDAIDAAMTAARPASGDK